MEGGRGMRKGWIGDGDFFVWGDGFGGCDGDLEGFLDEVGVGVGGMCC